MANGRKNLIGTELSGKNIGFIGFGRIAHEWVMKSLEYLQAHIRIYLLKLQ